MDKLRENLPLLILFLSLGVAALVIAVSRGWVRRNALLAGPRRSTGLGPGEVVMAIMLYLAGAASLHPVFAELGLLITDDQPTLTTRQTAFSAMIGQTFVQLPAAIMIITLTCVRTGGPRGLGLGLPGAGDLGRGAAGLCFAMPMVMATTACMLVISYLIELPTPKVGHEMLAKLLDSKDQLATTLMVTSAVVIAPLLEEILFRGLIQTVIVEGLEWTKRWTGVAVAAMIFSLIHGGVASWQVLPGLFVLGVVLGWLYERTGSLWPSIVLHAGFNALNIAIGAMGRQ